MIYNISCLLEMRKHTELLLEYGADPFIQNMYGQYPLQLLPRDATKSTKMFDPDRVHGKKIKLEEDLRLLRRELHSERGITLERLITLEKLNQEI